MDLTQTHEKFCHCCGKEYDLTDYTGGVTVSRDLGYGSKYDGEYLSMNICCSCMEKLIDGCKIVPFKRGGKRV